MRHGTIATCELVTEYAIATKDERFRHPITTLLFAFLRHTLVDGRILPSGEPNRSISLAVRSRDRCCLTHPHRWSYHRGPVAVDLRDPKQFCLSLEIALSGSYSAPRTANSSSLICGSSALQLSPTCLPIDRVNGTSTVRLKHRGSTVHDCPTYLGAFAPCDSADAVAMCARSFDDE
jgi:hypothetical protein